MSPVSASTAIQQQMIRTRCAHPSGGFVTFPKTALEQSLSDRFEQQVESYPERLAVKTRTHVFSYAELNEAANRVAHAILELHGDSNQPVALLFANGAPFVVASLAVAKTGKIQVPMESRFPDERLTYMLEQSEAALILTDEVHYPLARKLSALPVMKLEDIKAQYPSVNPRRAVPPGAWAAIGYTSGSTGRAKAIVRDHRCLLHRLMRLTNVTHMGTYDRLISCRATIRSYAYALLNGAAFFPVTLHQDEPTQLAEWMIQERITIYLGAVSMFRSFVGTLTGAEAFPSLRLILLYGEPVYHTDVERYRHHFADTCLLASSLGTSETDDYAYFFVDKEGAIPSGILPGGYLDADMEVLLLDEQGRPAGSGQLGEIAVRLHYGAVAYWKRADLTRAAFLPDPGGGYVYRTGDLGRQAPDGCLFHLGRNDFQVKIRGHRVDVGEVETALLALDSVKEATVIGREDVPGTTRLVAYLVPSETRTPSVSELRRMLAEKLPDYMVPSAFVTLDAMPLTATGKVDRRHLPPPGGVRPALDTPFVAPRTLLEECLAGIWAEVLALDRVGVDDNFLELGGHSLLATQVVSRVLELCRSWMPLRTLFESPTVAQMAAVVVWYMAAQLEQKELEPMLEELGSLSDEEARSLVKTDERQ